MAIPAWLPEVWSQLNDDDKKSVEQFMRFLLSQQKNETTINKTGFPFGILKGQIELSDNFDDPLYKLIDK